MPSSLYLVPCSDLACTQSYTAFGRLCLRRVDRVNVGIGRRFALNGRSRPDANRCIGDGCRSTGIGPRANRGTRVPISSAAGSHANTDICTPNDFGQ